MKERWSRSRVLYVALKVLVVFVYIAMWFNMFESEEWLHIISLILWTPAVFAIFFLKRSMEVIILMVTVGISFIVIPIVFYNLYGLAESVQPFVIFPILFYFLYLYYEDL